MSGWLVIGDEGCSISHAAVDCKHDKPSFAVINLRSINGSDVPLGVDHTEDE